MQTLDIRHLVEKSSEGRYYSIPFDVPEGAEALTVSYHYPRGEASVKNCIDLGLENADGVFLGWSGSARKSVTVGEYTATPGYRMQPVTPGRWRILIGAYHVAEHGVPVEYTVAFTEKKPRWLFGDLHMHSDASDGQHDIPTLCRMAKSKGLDFISITNHNNYAENLHLPKTPDLTLIPGVEWTHYKGHINFFGAAVPFSGFIANDEAEMHRVVDTARGAGSVISVNHPKCSLCPCLWEDDTFFDMMEIWNGPMRKDNLNAIRYWLQLLAQGRRIPAVGGSDFHRDRHPVRMANPVTAVYSPDRSADAILAAAAAGHSYITRGMNSPRLSLECGPYSFGDTAAAAANQPIRFAAEHLPRGAVLKLISADETGRPVTLAAAHRRKDGKAQGEFCPGDALPRFALLLAELTIPFIGQHPIAISNPLYFA